MGLNQALRDMFFRVNRYQVDGNCRKVADFLHDDVKSFYYERLDHPVSHCFARYRRLPVVAESALRTTLRRVCPSQTCW